jgi:hypothetical protein
MKIRSLSFLFAFLFLACHSKGQILNLKIPVKQEVKLGQEIRIALDVQGIKQYEIKMEDNPPGAVIEGSTFKWTPQIHEKDYYLVKFQLFDSTKTLMDETNLSLTVEPSDLKPYLIFNHPLPDTIKLVENESFSFTATIKSPQNTDPRLVMTYFTFNENPDLRSFDSCKVRINGDQLLFNWTPSNREAEQEYIKFRITGVDSDQSILSQVINFRIKNVNQVPYFKNEITDTIYLSLGQGLNINYAAVDPDNDRLEYDYSPKSPEYTLQGTQIVFNPNPAVAFAGDPNLPINLTLKVSDNKSTIKHKVTIIRNHTSSIGNPFLQPIIGDFTKKVFSEGDSVLTYLNISNYKDLKKLDIVYTDLTLPKGINSLTKYLVFEREGSYIKVYSKGILPYSLVNRDYNYNISVLISNKDPSRLPSFKVLVLTIENKPDPKNISQQRDSLMQSTNTFLSTENLYQSYLEKVHSRINRPWWKTAALITGTLSGVLTLVQSEHSDKTISAISASISLLSIMISNIPSLSEKTLSEVDEKIANSKARMKRVQEKESEFNLEWSIDIDQSDFDKMRTDIESIINKSTLKRNEDICSLLSNKKVKRKITSLIRKKSIDDKNLKNLEAIFKCRFK